MKRPTPLSGTRLGVIAGGFAHLVATAGAASGLATKARADASTPCNDGKSQQFELESTISFSSTRDNPTGTGVPLAHWGELRVKR